MINNAIYEFEYRRILATPKRMVHQFQVRGLEVLTFLVLIATASLLLFPNVPLIQQNEVSFVGGLVLIVQTLLSVMLLLKTLSRAAMVGGRERASERNWEAFVLTGADADTVIKGKWAAVVRSLWREYLWLGMLRGVAFPVALILYRIHSGYPYLTQGRYLLANFLPPLPTIGFVIVGVIALTMAQLLLMASIGMLAASRSAKHPTSGIRALSTWMMIAFGSAILIALIFFAYNQIVHMTAKQISIDEYFSWSVSDFNVLHTSILSAIAAADTAMISPTLMVNSVLFRQVGDWSGMASFGVVLVAFGFWTWVALRVSIIFSRWQGMTTARG